MAAVNEHFVETELKKKSNKHTYFTRSEMTAAGGRNAPQLYYNVGEVKWQQKKTNFFFGFESI